MSKMNLFNLLERLEKLVDAKFQLAGKVWIDKEQFEGLLEKIRIALPEEIKEAERLNLERERYLDQAQAEAERVLREAENYVQRLIHESQITVKAEEEADRIIDNAKRIATEIESDAYQYAAQIMEQLEQNLDRTLHIVRNGRDELNKQKKYNRLSEE